ncbi:MAG: glycosyltransferase family 2 protein [Bacteroidota bacterium]
MAAQQDRERSDNKKQKPDKKNTQQRKPVQDSRGREKQVSRSDSARSQAGQTERTTAKKPHQQKQKRDQGSFGIDISLVIPLYNEEESLPELSLMLEDELPKIGKYEVIFIDDGSTDDSLEVIKRIKRRNHNFKAISFRRNQGKSAALAVGFQEARGRIIATMDADLQDDPYEIRNMIKKLDEGYDLISGWKKIRKDPLSKTMPSKLFNLVTSMVSGLRLHDFNCGLKVYRKEAAKSLNVYGEMHRYLPALAHWEGFRVTELPVTHHARKYGRTKFGLSRFLNGFLDLLTVMFTTRYGRKPLHFFGLFGVLFTLIGFFTNLYLTFEWMMGKTFLSNRPLALLGIALIIVGVQFISMGLLGELIIKHAGKNINYSIKDKL